MNKQGFFITGTDTNVGKTWVTIALMRHFQRLGKSVVGMKPVAAGCQKQAEIWKNEDALLMQRYASITVAYELVNPYAYPMPVSPHLAGCENPVEMQVVLDRFRHLQALADLVVVEGAGGWLAPINEHQDISDLARQLGLPVIIVVGIKLGCLNHAKLTYRAIYDSGLNCAGWIANCIDPTMLMTQENIDTLKQAIAAPLLGVLPYTTHADFEYLADYIDMANLL